MKVTYEQCGLVAELIHVLVVLRVVRSTVPSWWGEVHDLDIRELYVE
jgi:hypothetical protein